jgi:hypothetical protein
MLSFIYQELVQVVVYFPISRIQTLFMEGEVWERCNLNS